MDIGSVKEMKEVRDFRWIEARFIDGIEENDDRKAA